MTGAESQAPVDPPDEVLLLLTEGLHGKPIKPST